MRGEKAINCHLRRYAHLYLIVNTLILFVFGLWPFNFNEKNNATISPEGGLRIDGHGTAYTATSTGKPQGIYRFTVLVDLETLSDGLDSLENIVGYFDNRADKNFFLAQWKDEIELNVRTERNPSGVIFSAAGMLEREKRISCLIMYDGTKMYFYVNNDLRKKVNRGLMSFSNWSKEYPLVVGTDAGGRAQWKGTIYQIVVWDRSLSPREIDSVTGDQWPVTSEKKEEKRPLIHYVFKEEYTYQTTFRGKKALGVRDLGKGRAADLVVPEYFEPYKRLFLGWDLDWATVKMNWLDTVNNVIGFIPFGFLLFVSFSKGRKGMGLQASGFRTRNRRPDSGFPLQDKYKTAIIVILAVVVGFGVSFAIEYPQAYLPSRDSSVRDLITNVLGTAIGSIGAAWMVRRGG